jgi:DNA-binding transcriptional ArsR family regulator
VAAAVASKRRSGGEKPKPQASKLVVATSHRIKVRCLIRMAERPTSPAAVGREIGIEASTVSYHVRKLAELNLVEQVDERPVRGAVEHFFRTVSLAAVNEAEYAALPLELRQAWIETVFGLFGADAMHSIEMGTLPNQVDCEISRTAMKVDRQGWADIKDAYVEAQERVMEIKAEAETRLATDEDLEPLPILSFLSLFEMPPAKY